MEPKEVHSFTGSDYERKLLYLIYDLADELQNWILGETDKAQKAWAEELLQRANAEVLDSELVAMRLGVIPLLRGDYENYWSHGHTHTAPVEETDD